MLKSYLAPVWVYPVYSILFDLIGLLQASMTRASSERRTDSQSIWTLQTSVISLASDSIVMAPCDENEDPGVYGFRPRVSCSEW